MSFQIPTDVCFVITLITQQRFFLFKLSLAHWPLSIPLTSTSHFLIHVGYVHEHLGFPKSCRKITFCATTFLSSMSRFSVLFHFKRMKTIKFTKVACPRLLIETVKVSYALCHHFQNQNALPSGAFSFLVPFISLLHKIHRREPC